MNNQFDKAEQVGEEQQRVGEGKLKDRLARAVFVIDQEGFISYCEVVAEITDEVDYDKCIEAALQAANFKKKGHDHESWMGA